jgi:hypothetical protein
MVRHDELSHQQQKHDQEKDPARTQRRADCATDIEGR